MACLDKGKMANWSLKKKNSTRVAPSTDLEGAVANLCGLDVAVVERGELSLIDLMHALTMPHVTQNQDDGDEHHDDQEWAAHGNRQMDVSRTVRRCQPQTRNFNTSKAMM